MEGRTSVLIGSPVGQNEITQLSLELLGDKYRTFDGPEKERFYWSVIKKGGMCKGVLDRDPT
jgi:hypothetical protein